jgi:hypothetical protein
VCVVCTVVVDCCSCCHAVANFTSRVMVPTESERAASARADDVRSTDPRRVGSADEIRDSLSARVTSRLIMLFRSTPRRTGGDGVRAAWLDPVAAVEPPLGGSSVTAAALWGRAVIGPGAERLRFSAASGVAVVVGAVEAAVNIDSAVPRMKSIVGFWSMPPRVGVAAGVLLRDAVNGDVSAAMRTLPMVPTLARSTPRWGVDKSGTAAGTGRGGVPWSMWETIRQVKTITERDTI